MPIRPPSSMRAHKLLPDDTKLIRSQLNSHMIIDTSSTHPSELLQIEEVAVPGALMPEAFERNGAAHRGPSWSPPLSATAASARRLPAASLRLQPPQDVIGSSSWLRVARCGDMRVAATAGRHCANSVEQVSMAHGIIVADAREGPACASFLDHQSFAHLLATVMHSTEACHQIVEGMRVDDGIPVRNLSECHLPCSGGVQLAQEIEDLLGVRVCLRPQRHRLELAREGLHGRVLATPPPLAWGGAAAQVHAAALGQAATPRLGVLGLGTGASLPDTVAAALDAGGGG
eukprot:CAMPEP_0179248530 /NCGR_PEP_ID=MMETSP0797-20121207/20173_1 /TAXON_ID=47934 /ORGANISM="Dinophysis acuminata, Strain DAEP01" /LENGTH=287 /DNA_ID=CAMNT_0020956185 /DNA_START=157 /DNA_END=1019 /DNA_ORIENTATION=-